MKLFADASMLLAAAGSEIGASHAIFDLSQQQGWEIISSPYALDETEKNLKKLPATATKRWTRLRPQLTLVDDIVVLDRPSVFMAAKDHPILFTALAHAHVLLTLDKTDFGEVLGGSFYGLLVLLPYDFLQRERDAGRLSSMR